LEIMALMAPPVHLDPREPLASQDRISRLPWRLRLLLLRRLWWLPSLLLRLLPLLRRLRRRLRLLLSKLVKLLDRRVLPVVREAKETLERTARRETPVLVAALVRLARLVIQALPGQVEPLVQRDRLQV